MKTYVDEMNNTVKAKNYWEAAEKLYGQHKSYSGTFTTYAEVHRGYAFARVYKEGDKVGSYWGVQSARPVVHTITIKY